MNLPQNTAFEESDVESTTSTATRLSVRPTRAWFLSYRLPTVPLLYRNIFKCSLAYLIASLFTFSPYLSGVIRDFPTYGNFERRPVSNGYLVAAVFVNF